MSSPGQDKLWSIPGDGVLARQGSLVLLTSIDDHEFAESLLEALASTSEAGGDGRALGDAISAQVEEHQSWGGLEGGPTIVAFGPARDGIAFTILGAAAVEFSTSHAAEHRLTADHPSMLMRSTVGVPVRSIRATLNRDETGSGTDRFTRLDSGTVRAGGLSYYSGPVGASKPPPPVPPASRPAPASSPVPPPPPAPAPVPEPSAASAPPGPPGPQAPVAEVTPFEVPSSGAPLPGTSMPPESAERPSSTGPVLSGPLPGEPRPVPGRIKPLSDEPAAAQSSPAPAQSSYPRTTFQQTSSQQPAYQQTSEPDTMPPASRPPEAAPAEPAPAEPAPAEPASTPRTPTKPTPFDPAKYGASASPFGTEPGVVVNTGPSAAPPADSTQVDMTSPEPAPGPGPTFSGPGPDGPGGSDPGRHGAPAIVLGVYCKNGHFTDPDERSCLTCGTPIKKRAAAQQPGPRPPMGVLVFDDGEVLAVDGDYILGRSPARDQAVESGTARPLRVVDDKGMVSRVHARIHLDGWKVLVTDLGSANGTYVQPQGAPGPQRLEPHIPMPIQPGALFYVGSACLRYEQARS